MTDSAFHMILAGCCFVAGLVFTLMPGGIASRIRRTWWEDANRELFVRVTRAIPTTWRCKVQRLYERASMERSIRWFGFILLGGSLVEVWAAAILKSSS